MLERVSRSYPMRRGRVSALIEVSLLLARGETLAVIGASGSGKSTLARLALGLDRPDEGRITLGGRDWAFARGAGLRAMRRRVQAVFQDPAASFDPRQTVERIFAEPLHLLGRISAAERREKVAEALAQVGLPADAMERLPQAFSGGQRQRIAIARVMLKDAPILVLDEATSALDSEVEAAIQASLYSRIEGKTVLAIAHRLSTIAAMDRLIVLDGGRIVEMGDHKSLLARRGLYARLWAHQSGGFLGEDADEGEALDEAALLK
jgi:ATP-binding cassette subfamily B multidrug efflux pump